MIGYYGKWGSGKTLSLVAEVYRRWIKNPDLVVFTNVPMSFGYHPKKGTELIRYGYSEIIDLQPFFIYAINSPHDILAKETVVVIDESSVVLSSRTFAALPMFMISFLAQARHINTDFLITAQEQWEVEKIVRALTSHWYHCHRVPLLGWITKEKEVIDKEGRIRSRSMTIPLFNVKKFYKFYNTYHIAHFGDHQLKNVEKEHKAPRELSDFLQFAYKETHLKITRVKTKEIPLIQKYRESKVLTNEGIIVKTRDDIFTINCII
jgi:hypothetical protein